jgi:hypothetical protein
MDYQKIQKEVEKQELFAICSEIRSYGEIIVSNLEKAYKEKLENIKLRWLLISLRNLRESNLKGI